MIDQLLMAADLYKTMRRIKALLSSRDLALVWAIKHFQPYL